jgi:hypothetical protein
MRITGTNSLQGLLALGLMNGLVACGSFANCFNSGFAPAACGGGYSESNASSLPRPMPPRRKVAGRGDFTPAEPSLGWSWRTARIGCSIRHETIPTSWLDWFRERARRTPAPSVPQIREILIWKARAFVRRRCVAAMCRTRAFRGRSPTSTGDTESFTSTSDADSESAPNLTQVTGTYVGLRADNHTVTVTVDSTGTLSRSCLRWMHRCWNLVSSGQGTMCFIPR